MQLPTDIWQAATSPMLSHVNVGTGIDCTIAELAQTLAKVTGFAGTLRFDAGKPDGTPRKLLDVSLLRSLGWQASITLEDGLRATYQWYLSHHEHARS
jgi:GDP-L-fucose synthase